jgi:hypothetical protein
MDFGDRPGDTIKKCGLLRPYPRTRDCRGKTHRGLRSRSGSNGEDLRIQFDAMLIEVRVA